MSEDRVVQKTRHQVWPVRKLCHTKPNSSNCYFWLCRAELKDFWRLTLGIKRSYLPWADTTPSVSKVRNDPFSCYPSKHDTLTNAGLMLVQRLRRWPNIKPALVKRVVFSGTELYRPRGIQLVCWLYEGRSWLRSRPVADVPCLQTFA